jgi:hypothetical protein
MTKLKKSVLKYAIGGGLLFGLVSTFMLPGGWSDLFRRVLHATSGGRGESASWGEPLFYMMIYAVPRSLIGIVIGVIIGTILVRQRHSM